MPIDPNIALSVRPVQTPNMLGQYAQAQEMNVNALKMQEAQQAIEDRNALRGLDFKSPDYISQVGKVNPKLALELQKGRTEARTAELDQRAKIGSLLKTSAASVLANPTLESAVMALQSFSKATGDDVTAEFNALQKIGNNPEAITKWAMGHALSGDQILNQTTLSANQKAQLAQSAQHHRENLNKPQYMQTDAGLVALPNVLKPGQAPVGTMVTGPNGENLSRPLKDIPAVASKAITENQIALNKVNRALDLNAGKEITLPSGDKIQGDADATGFWKGLLPQVILNSWDPKGVATRAFIADIGSLKVHDRSGAAVTASETPRLKPFIPAIGDSAEVAATKLANFKAEYEDMQNSFAEMYSREQGYRPNPMLTNKGSNAVQPMYATNGTQRIVSNDGGATWQPVGAK